MEVRWERMFVDELENRFREVPLAYFPYGVCEPHGPQCTVGTDGLRAHGLLCRTAQAHGGIVAPVDYWHMGESGGEAAWAYETVGEVERTWFTAIPPWLFYKNMLYHIRLADSLGFHAAIFLTGHEGPLMDDMKRLVGMMQPHVGTRLLALGISDVNTYKFDGEGDSGHADKIETSELMALNPECVDLTRIDTIQVPGNGFAMGPEARLSNRRVGERMIASEMDGLGRRGRELLQQYQTLKPEHKLKSFGQVEEIWDREVKPALSDFEMMQDLFRGFDQAPVPEHSRWYGNWRLPISWS